MATDTTESPTGGSEEMAARIRDLASRGDFAEADALRSRLMQHSPNAIGLIIETGELIEQEKTRRLDANHLARWSALYEVLGEEETNVLFYCLKEDRIAEGKVLFLQGKPNARLFFVEDGEITLFFRKDGKNVPLAKLGRGAVLGEDTFFGISLCTFSAVTQSAAHLRHLSRAAVADWSDEHPGLYGKLRDFCWRSGTAADAVARKNLERRNYERIAMSAVATAAILDKDGKASSTYFKGGVIDVSRSGVCFSMKCSKQETARALLGREIGLVLADPDTESPIFRTRGMIVKVSFLLHNDYHVHVRFIEVIEQSVLAGLCRSTGMRQRQSREE